MSTLYILGGLPASGKSTLARHLARSSNTVYLRIDSIEEAIYSAGELRGPEGYFAAYRIAADNLALGQSVVADSVNPMAVTRNAWRELALSSAVAFKEIEVCCSSLEEHRRRLEARPAGLSKLSWDDVLKREYEPWPEATCFDTAGETVHQSCERFVNSFLK